MKRILLILCIVVIFLSGCVPVSSPATLPMDFDSITEIIIYNDAAAESFEYKIEEKDSIRTVCDIIKEVEHTGLLGDPSCPFGLKLIVCNDIDKYTLSLSTDGCGVIMYNDEYYSTYNERRFRESIEDIIGESFDIFLE